MLGNWLLSTVEGRSPVVDIWRDMFIEAAENRTFGADMFAGLVSNRSKAAWSAVVPLPTETGESRYDGLGKAMDLMGYKLVQLELSAYSSADLIAPMIFQFLNAECGPGSRGFWTQSDHIKLDRGDRCGIMSGDPVVPTIGGFNIVKQAYEAHQLDESACKTGKSVSL